MLIASCTSWPKRVLNLPIVIDSILNNTCPPDKVIINLSKDEFPNLVLPKEIDEYIKAHPVVSIHWCEGNWKVYKKFLPILSKYPNDLILSFDDDTIYPSGIIEDLLKVHSQYPDDPISCNHYWFNGQKCHCGECSLTQAKHFKGWEQYVSEEMISKCPADDLFYTNLAAINGYFYRNTDIDYPRSWQKFQEVDGYSRSIPEINKKTSEALYQLFGMRVIKKFSEGEKPVCVLNCLANIRGKAIEQQMLEWLTPLYNIYIVEHDGTKFEYPGLRFVQTLAENNLVSSPVLYLHSKGAVKVRACSEKVHRCWRLEFGGKSLSRNLEILSTDTPTMITPYAGHSINPREGYKGDYPVPWYNGWMANLAAIQLLNIPLSQDRFVYETCIYRGINIMGTRMSDIAWTAEDMARKDQDLNTHF